MIVMRDLGDAVLTWDDRLSAARTHWVVDGWPRCTGRSSVTPGRAWLRSTACSTCSRRTGSRGWPRRQRADGAGAAAAGRSSRTRPRRRRRPGARLLDDVAPLADALAAGPVTLIHGDLATVNMAFEGDDLVLLDWAMPTAAPGALDVARFLAGCASVVDAEPRGAARGVPRAAGPAYDERSMRLALLAALVWLGWNKALDAAEHPDPAIRDREKADLDWWVREARTTLERGAL